MPSLLTGLAALFVVALAGGDHGSSWWPFLGRFHPLFVHVPITVLLLAIVAALATRSPSRVPYRVVVSPLLLVGAWSAIITAMIGLVLADWGSYDPAALVWHKRLGIALPVAAVLAFWLHQRSMTRTASAGAAVGAQANRALSLVSGVLVVVLVAGAHKGGVLSRGDQYLTKHLPDGIRHATGLPLSQEITHIRLKSPESAPVYDSLIQPLLTARCAACHNAERKKGGLDLTSARGLEAGGRQGKVLVAGRADDSELIIRLTLPEGHIDAMPPDRALPHAELALIRWWIDQGASTTVTVSEIERPASIRRTLAAYGLDDLPEGVFALPIGIPDTAAISAARKSGLGVQTVGVNVGYVSVDAGSVAAGWEAGTLEALKPLAQHVVTVDLARTSAGDAALSTLGTMPHLTRLQLSKTRVTDAGMDALRALQYLEYVNLVDTDITDAGLRALERLPRLRAIYLWGTRTTEGGVARLQRALPNASIVVGAPVLLEPAPVVDSAPAAGKATNSRPKAAGKAR